MMTDSEEQTKRPARRKIVSTFQDTSDGLWYDELTCGHTVDAGSAAYKTRVCYRCTVGERRYFEVLEPVGFRGVMSDI